MTEVVDAMAQFLEDLENELWLIQQQYIVGQEEGLAPHLKSLRMSLQEVANALRGRAVQVKAAMN